MDKDHRRYMKVLKLDEAEIRSRRSFFELTDADLRRLDALRPFAEKHTDAIVEDLYKLLLSHPETKNFFPDEATVRRVKRLQHDYFLGLFAGKCDLAYVEDRLRVGAAHERIGLSPKWYLGAYRKYKRLIFARLFDELKDREELFLAIESIQKILYFDTALAIDTYIAAKVEALERHQDAIRELSTPVIRVYNRILLLPLIGAIDSRRAEQIMDSVLLKTAETQARCIIIDIAGVPIVDTKVAADSLMKTTAAARLLGAEVILTGIAAPVARTIIQLGVDLSRMHTLSSLAEGIELALTFVGKSIRPGKRAESSALGWQQGKKAPGT